MLSVLRDCFEDSLAFHQHQSYSISMKPRLCFLGEHNSRQVTHCFLSSTTHTHSRCISCMEVWNVTVVLWEKIHWSNVTHQERGYWICMDPRNNPIQHTLFTDEETSLEFHSSSRIFYVDSAIFSLVANQNFVWLIIFDKN